MHAHSLTRTHTHTHVSLHAAVHITHQHNVCSMLTDPLCGCGEGHTVRPCSVRVQYFWKTVFVETLGLEGGGGGSESEEAIGCKRKSQHQHVLNPLPFFFFSLLPTPSPHLALRGRVWQQPYKYIHMTYRSALYLQRFYVFSPHKHTQRPSHITPPVARSSLFKC